MLNKENQKQLIDRMAFSTMESMDYKTMEIYVVDQLTNYYNTLTVKELEEEAEHYYEMAINDVIKEYL